MMIYSAFSCRRGSLTIRGMEIRPEGDRLPIVIVSHGFMANKESVQAYAEWFAGMGFAAYCFDFCGGCIRGESDGKTTDMTVLTEVEDLFAVLEYARSLPYTDEGRITLMGCSQGGFVSQLLAARLGEEIEQITLFFPALCIPDDARRGQLIMFRFDPRNPPEEMPSRQFTLGRAYPEAVMDMDAMEAIKGYGGRVLLIHGKADRLVDYRYSQRAKEVYGANCRLVLMENAGHGFTKEEDETALGCIREFLAGREELFAVDVTITGQKLEHLDGKRTRLTLPFTGTAAGAFFTGKIRPGAADVQVKDGDEIERFCADYVISGRDYTGTECYMHVVNVNTGNGWKPTLETNSKALAFLNGADCTVVLENKEQGPVVRIYTRIEPWKASLVDNS